MVVIHISPGAWEQPALKCDWFFNFAHQRDHFYYSDWSGSQQARDPAQMNKGKCQWCVAYLLGKQLPPSAIAPAAARTHCEINYAFNFYQTSEWALLLGCFLSAEGSQRCGERTGIFIHSEITTIEGHIMFPFTDIKCLTHNDPLS